MRRKRIVLFASGKGSNVQAILNFFREHEQVQFVHLYCNKPGAGVLDLAEKEKIPVTLFADKRIFSEGAWVSDLERLQPDLIVLAGFLWLMPQPAVAAFPARIINIHPALLPAYGGKGMYGMRVHQAVIKNREQQSGITIHQVNERYDEGTILLQATCTVHPADTPETLASRIHSLEHHHYPRVLATLLGIEV